jgi:DNA-binding response OmpR family regulator
MNRPDKVEHIPKVLLVSNQQTTGPLWAFSLQQQKIRVALEVEPLNTLKRWMEESPDLIILDVTLDDLVILDILRSLRDETVTPILLLFPARTEEFILNAYRAGADDVLVKPVSPSLFQAKVRVWLRRSWSAPVEMMEPISAGGFQLIPAEKMVIGRNGKPHALTSLELRLLYFLMSEARRVLTADDLIQRVWGYSGEQDHAMLKNLVYRLRRKIETNPAQPRYLQTVTGLGYKFVPE